MPLDKSNVAEEWETRLCPVLAPMPTLRWELQLLQVKMILKLPSMYDYFSLFNDGIKTCWNQHITGIVHCTLNSQSMAKFRTGL
jgi:hypothetical protein